MYTNLNVGSQHAHALFFGFDGGDKDSWRGALNSDNQADEYRENLRKDKGGVAKMRDRFHRLGIEPHNNRRNQIRIAPTMGADISKGCLSEKIEYLRHWIREPLCQAK